MLYSESSSDISIEEPKNKNQESWYWKTSIVTIMILGGVLAVEIVNTYAVFYLAKAVEDFKDEISHFKIL